MRGVPGQALAAQREALGWSVEQVADQLKLAMRPGHRTGSGRLRRAAQQVLDHPTNSSVLTLANV
ncbi:helix-turn-helix domain-containing protein, partial [Massilia phosphatilytica]